MRKKAFAVGAAGRTPPEMFTELPRPLTGFWGKWR